MQKKNKAMLVAAIGMVAIVVASTAVRCSVSHATDEVRTQEDAPAIEQSAEAEKAAVGEAEKGAAEEALSILKGHAWQAADDPGRALAFRDGSFVETAPDGMSLTAFEVKDAGAGTGQLWVDASCTRQGEAEARTATIVIDEKGGSFEVASDAFAMSARYVQAASTEGPVSVSGLSEPYTSLVDGKTADLASALTKWCRENAPTATSASFDGEVYLDIPNGRVSATFHLDDAGSSIATCVYEAGAFSVLG